MENNVKFFESKFDDDLKHLEVTSDGKLRIEDGHTFSIHKYNLAKRSRYFYALFCGTGKNRDDILIPGINGEDLDNILSYLYTDNIHVTQRNICNLVIASDYLLLDDLLSRIKSFFRKNLTITNSVSVFNAAQQINRDDFSRESFRFIQTHFQSIVYCPDSEICELPLDALKLLLRDKNLCVRSERTVWLAVVKWVEADILNRLSWVADLLTYLTIFDIDESLVRVILQHDIVAKNANCQEILDIKSRFYNADNLKILQYYSQTHSKPLLTLCDRRQPTKLYYVARYRKSNHSEGIEVYLTYDENIDLWRKILEIDLRPEILLSLNDCIYMFQIKKSRNLCYNVVEKQWNEMRDFIAARKHYVVVELNGLLYVFWDGRQDIYDVEFYDPETDEWYGTTAMMPAIIISAAAHRHLIYVIGNTPGGLEHGEMIVQVYDPSSETWNILSSPILNRIHSAMVVYRDVIYVIGGYDAVFWTTKSVQVFDPIKNKWSTEVDIPYIYYFPKAIVLNHTLIVYEGSLSDCKCGKVRAIQLNSDKKKWEPFGGSSSMNIYYFATLENSESINDISSENKDLTTHFENTPFV